ncbi:MAG: tyrosine-type recombinase/integrase [Nitrospirae bacterium]|nr:tyrosine-type recombinase/integrase [Nitrospirota bacterium]
MAGSSTIQDTIDRFIAEVQVGRSKETARAYSTALECFKDYLKQVPVDPLKARVTALKVEDLLDYPLWLTGERWRDRANPASVAVYLAGLQSWLRYLAREKLHPSLSSEMERIREAYRAIRRRGARKLPRVLQPNEMEAIIKAARARPNTRKPRLFVAWRRDVALIETLRCTGTRISEILGGNAEDLQARQRALRVMGKGSRERLVFFDVRGWDAMEEYLEVRKSLKLICKGKVTPLFAQHSRAAGKELLRLTPRGARLALWQYVRKAGLQGKITPHRFRATFATMVLEKTGDLAATQDLLGHASPATTRIYAKLATARLKKIHEQVFEA